MINIIVFGHIEPALSIEMIRQTMGETPFRLFVQTVDDQIPRLDPPCIDAVNVWIKDKRLLALLRAVQVHTEPVLFIHSGDLLLSFKGIYHLQNILIPKDSISIYGMTFPMDAIKRYINMCKAVNIINGDEESLIRYIGTLIGGKDLTDEYVVDTHEHTIPIIEDRIITENIDKLQSYWKQNPKDIIYDKNISKSKFLTLMKERDI